jgi:hypothetical protein
MPLIMSKKNPNIDYIEKLYQDLSVKDVEFNALPQKSPDGLVKFTFCKDPDGTPIELVEILNLV